MDELFSLIIFVIFIVASIVSSLVNRARQRRAEGEQPSQRPVRREDLPPETRRQLYGESTVRRAEARRPSSPFDQPEEEYDGEGVNDEDMEERIPPPVRPRPVVMRETPPAVPRPIDARQAEYEARRRAEEAQRLQEERARRQAVEERQRRIEQERRARQEQARREAARREAPQQPAPTRRAPAESVYGAGMEADGSSIPPIAQALREGGPGRRRRGPSFLGDRDDLRKAILLREILGPPKALEDFATGPDNRF